MRDVENNGDTEERVQSCIDLSEFDGFDTTLARGETSEMSLMEFDPKYRSLCDALSVC